MPGSIIANMPPRDDDPQRRQRDLERQAREQAAAKSGQAMQIGAGGIKVTDGGSITIEGSGALNVGSGALNSAGSISAATTITAGGNVTGGGLVSTGSLSVAGVGSFGGNVSGAVAIFNGGVISTGVYNNLLTSGYRVQYIDSGGNMGYVPSSRRFKQDITDAPDVKSAMLAIQIVTFRYIEAVQELGDAAAIEWGVIAEEIDALGLTWAVDYDAEGKPFGVRYERLVLACVPVIQDHEARLKAAGL